MRGVLLGLVLVGCMPVRVATPAPEPEPEPRRFKVKPQLVKLNEPRAQAVNRVAQLALGLGMQADGLSLGDGYFRGRRVRLDEWATSRLYDRRADVEVVRKFEVVVVAGDGSATFSPTVIRCVRKPREPEVCDDLPTDLEEDELRILDSMMRIVMAPAAPPTGTDI